MRSLLKLFEMDVTQSHQPRCGNISHVKVERILNLQWQFYDLLVD